MKKVEIITFKADKALVTRLNSIPNKSEYIRNAVLTAMSNTCPLCQGTGILSESQQQHWDSFSNVHKMVRCGKCNDLHISCESALNKDKGKGKR